MEPDSLAPAGRQAGDAQRRHGLARTALAGEPEHLAVRHDQRQALDHLGPTVPGPDLDGQILDGEERLRRRWSRRPRPARPAW